MSRSRDCASCSTSCGSEREELLEQGDLGGAYSEIAEELQDVLREERLGIERLESDARDSGDQRRQEVTDQVATERRMQLDLLPNDLAGQVAEPAELRVRVVRSP